MKALGIGEADLRGLVDDIWGSLFDPAPEEFDASVPGALVTGYVDITGGWEGRVLVSTTEDGAVAIAARLLDLPTEAIEPVDLDDAIGELANIVGGSVKSCVEGFSALSLPCVSHHGAPAGLDGLEVTALWNDHPICVRVTTRPPLLPSGRPSTEGELA